MNNLKLTFFILDVNECQDLANHGCEQQCNNTIGSYKCTCDDGFALGEDEKSCFGIATDSITVLLFWLE